MVVSHHQEALLAAYATPQYLDQAVIPFEPLMEPT